MEYLVPKTPAGHALLAIFFGLIVSVHALVIGGIESILVLQLSVLIAIILLVGLFGFSHRKSSGTEEYAMYVSLLSIPFMFFAWLLPAIQLVFGNYSLTLHALTTYQILIIATGVFHFGRLCTILLVSAYLKAVYKNKDPNIEAGLAPSLEIKLLPKMQFLVIASVCGLLSYFLTNDTLLFKYLSALAISTLAIDLIEIFERKLGRTSLN